MGDACVCVLVEQDLGDMTHALEASERMLGPEHPATMARVSALAGYLVALGRAAEALPLYARAVEASERTLGAEHPDTLVLVGRMGSCMAALGRDVEALALHQRAMGHN
jgi:hypothetical protein